MKKQAHIAVMRLSAMGDVAMLVPVLQNLSNTYPLLGIVVITKPLYASFFKEIPNLTVIAADVKGKHKGIKGLFLLSKEIKKQNIHAFADTHNVLRSKIVRVLLWLQGIKTASIDKGRSNKKKLINANGGNIHPLKTTHQRYADVFKALGFPIDITVPQFACRRPVSGAIQKLIGNEPKKIIGIAPFAAHKGKMYPLHLMKEVLEHLSISGNYKIFLFGGGTTETQQLKKLASSFELVTNVAGTYSFEEELALISNLDVMVSMDSGNGHLAAMFAVPVITLWGVTHPYAGFVPYHQPNKHQLIADRSAFPKVPTSIYGNSYPAGYEKAIETIPPTLVAKKVLELL